MSCQFMMWGYVCFLLVQMPITMQMHMCFEHMSLRFLFYFDVLVTGDNYAQYKLITRETDWITSRQSLQWGTCLLSPRYTHQCSNYSVDFRKFWGPDIWKVTRLFATVLPNSCLSETSRSKAVLGSPVLAVQLRLSYLTPNQLWICGRVLLWVSDNVNDRMDRHWREKRKIPINNWSCQKCFVSMQIYHLPSSKSFLV